MIQSRIIVWILDTCESIPQIAGPMRNAIPNAAPMSHIFFALSSGLDISDIYACITQNHAPQSPPTKRAKRKRRNIGVSPWKIARKCPREDPLHSLATILTPDVSSVSDHTLTSMMI
jgi:hypothetical protein